VLLLGDAGAQCCVEEGNLIQRNRLASSRLARMRVRSRRRPAAAQRCCAWTAARHRQRGRAARALWRACARAGGAAVPPAARRVRMRRPDVRLCGASLRGECAEPMRWADVQERCRACSHQRLVASPSLVVRLLCAQSLCASCADTTSAQKSAVKERPRSLCMPHICNCEPGFQSTSGTCWDQSLSQCLGKTANTEHQPCMRGRAPAMASAPDAELAAWLGASRPHFDGLLQHLLDWHSTRGAPAVPSAPLQA